MQSWAAAYNRVRSLLIDEIRPSNQHNHLARHPGQTFRRSAVTDLNPQAKQMADESMVRGLDAQARAIWPQEVHFIRRYAIPNDSVRWG
jgi:hypothetical protein